MKIKWLGASLIVLGLMWTHSTAAQIRTFDGLWSVTVSCPGVADADGYTLRFPARVVDGALLGENGMPGSAGYLRLAGRIQGDGGAVLTADGLVGNPRVAIGRVPTLTPYHYTAAIRFSGNSGEGQRMSTRPCTLTFLRS